VFLEELRGDRIVRERRIYDFTTLAQLGVLKAKPASVGRPEGRPLRV
jgi:hypothetical protein